MKINSLRSSAFLKVFFNGLSAPFYVISPPKIQTPKKRNISKKEISSLDHDPYSGFLKDKESLERDYKKIFGKDKS